jgi:ABC-type polysaccharide/polyol phosphate transport system ATPase subunit
VDNPRNDTIVVDGVSKYYYLRQGKQALIEQAYKWLTGTLPKPREICALRDVTFHVKRGESVGVIGRNGAGKSTLLKILAGIATPSYGKVHVAGRISTQIALGSGFHPFLTGRENVFLQGSILGMSNREVSGLMPEIVNFAGLDSAIDRQLWTYSNGMVARLGFSVAAHAKFEVLLLDEALSAGDLGFRARCEDTLRRFRASGATLVIVSHGSESIYDLCDRAIWLDQGKIKVMGKAPEVIELYEGSVGHVRSRQGKSA